MTKRGTLLLAMLMLCTALLTACGESGGNTLKDTKWLLTGVTDETGTEVDASSMEMLIEFTANKASITMYGELMGESEYKVDGSTVTITDPDGTVLDLKMDGNKMTTEDSGVTMVYTKQ